MGGKHKQAQRTKDNAKPSSSGRSAALLANTTSPVPNFAAVTDCGYVPIFPYLPAAPTEEFDAGIDSNFQLVLKKMNKKDSTTRLKALQEFTSLVSSLELDAVKAVLPFWPRLYCLLAGDIEHRVREAAQEAHRMMVMRTKRNMAPYLKQVAGHWFVAQYDTYPPVGTAATRAFQDAFPANKLVEAIMFCRDEILKYICDNLLGQISQTTNSAKNVSADKLKARQQRIMVSCMQAFASFLRLVPPNQLSTVAALPVVQNLVGSKRFWELPSDKAPAVRSAWMCVLTAILERVPQIFSDRQSQVVQAVLTRLGDSDPSVLPYVWEAGLHVFSTVQDLEAHGNLEKQVLPPLWQILKEAGHGTAAAIFPNLLPVLSCLLKTRKTPADKEVLCEQFFGNLREGFVKKSVVQSRAESEAVAQCYIECVRYISSCNTCSPEQLVKNYLISAVDITLTNLELTLLSKALFEHISSLVQYWSRNRTNSAYAVMLQCFWDNLANVYTRCVKSSDIAASSQQVEFCICLNCSGKPRKKVHFGSQAEDVKLKLKSPSDGLQDEHFKTELKKFVHIVCALYLSELQENKRSCFIVPLSKLVTIFNSSKLFDELCLSRSINDVLGFINKSWSTYNDSCKRAAMEVVFCWVQHLEAEQKLTTLWNLSQEGDMMLRLLEVTRTHCNEDPLVKEWLHGPNLRAKLVLLAQEVFSVSSSAYIRNILRECFSPTGDGGLLVGGETVSAILAELCSAVSQELTNADFVAELVSAVSGSICSEVIKDSLQHAVLVLFDLCCNPSDEGSFMPPSLQLACHNGLTALKSVEDEALVPALMNHFSNTVKEKLCAKEVLSAKDIHHLVKVAAEVIIAVSSDGSSTSAVTATFLKGMESEFGEWDQQLMTLCLDVEKLAGATGIEPLTPHRCDYSNIRLEQYFNLSLFSLHLMAQVVFNLEEEEEEIGSKFNPKKLNPDGKIIMSDHKNSDTDIGDNVEVSSAAIDKALEDTDPSQCTSKVLDNSSSVEDNEPSESSGELVEEDLQEVQMEIVTTVYEDTLPSLKERSHAAPKSECVLHLQGSILHVVCCVAVCKVFRRHCQSTVYYSNIYPHISTFQKCYEEMMTLLRSAGLISGLEDITTEKAKDHGGLWIWVRYLLSGPDKLIATYDTLRDAGRGDYSAQVLAQLMETPLPPSQLESRHPDVLKQLIIGAFGTWPELNKEHFVHEIEMSCKDHSKMEKISEMIHALASCITQCPDLLTPVIWDFILLSTPFYVQCLASQQPQLFLEALLATSLQPVHNMSVFTVAVCELYCSLAQHIQRVMREQDATFLKQTLKWNDRFSGVVHQQFLTIFMRIADLVKQEKPSLIGQRLLQSVCCVIVDLEANHLTFKPEMPVTLQGLLDVACNLIHCSVQPVQVAAYHLLKKSLPHLVEADAMFVGSLEVEDPEETVANAQDLKVYTLLEQLKETQAVVDIMLADFRFGDTCLVQPHTDSHHYTTAYLLLWDLLLDACSLAGSELRYHYASIFRENGSLQSLLYHLFFLMPEEVLELPSSRVMAHLFQAPPATAPGDSCTTLELQHWACWVYHSALRRLPALVRQWWGDTKAKVKTVVQRVTYDYVSPLLCHNELHAIQTNNIKLKNMEVKVMIRAREVVATYAVDETRMELVITLPDVYPLGMVQVNSNAPLVGTNQWRNWVRHLSIFLTHQNGSVWDGLLLWKSNLDKRFEGVEECYICFSILHGSNFQIPKLCCKTCKKKFHSPCLYKWFSTSNKSTCPICRNMF